MLSKDLLEKKQYFIENYEKLKKELGWKVDKQVIMILASQYAGNQKIVDIDSLKNIDAELKKETGFFTTLNTNVRHCLAALLDTTADIPAEAIRIWKDNYDLFVQKKFARGVFTYFTAYQLLFIPEYDREQTITKALSVYKELRKQHFFLTGNEDYPAVMLLATLQQPVENIVETTKSYYQDLAAQGFFKGNELQFLANILTFSNEKHEDVIKRVVYVKDQFTQRGVKVKRSHYTSLGILGLMNIEEEEIQSIIELIEELKKEKILRWNKDLAVSLGIDLFVKNKSKDNSLVDTGLMVAMETIIQAQQAAMIAATAAITASSSSSSSN